MRASLARSHQGNRGVRANLEKAASVPLARLFKE
jgi:hypothetical protein